jgi:hypothetical protein
MPRPRSIAAWTAGVLLVVLAAGLLAFRFAPVMLGEPRLKAEIARRLEAALGLPVSIDGPLLVETGTTLSVDAHEVRIGRAGAVPVATLRRVRASVETASLAAGAVRIGAVTIDGLGVTLEVDAAGGSNWTPVSRSAPAGPARRWTLGSLSVGDATFRYRDRARSTDYALEHASLTAGPVALPAPFPLTIRGVASLAGREVGSLDLRSTVAIDAAAGRTSLTGVRVDAAWRRAQGAVPATLSLGRLDVSGAPATATVSGLVLTAAGATVRLDGRAALAPVGGEFALVVPAFDPRAAFAAFGAAPPAMAGPDALARAAFTGRLVLAPDGVRLADLAGTVDDTRVRGDGAYAASRVAVDLAADRVAADRYLPPATRTRTPVVLPLDSLRAAPVDGRLVVGELLVRGIAMKDVTIELGRGGANAANGARP